MPRDHGAEWFADAILNTASVYIAFVACLILAVIAVRRVRCMGACPERVLLPVSLTLYGVGLFTMLACSTAYNLYVDHPHRDLLRQIDHAGIFVMIAGTYSPLALLSVRGTTGQRLFAAIWGVTNVCIALKFLAPESFEQFSVLVYVLLGAAIITVRRPLQTTLPAAGMVLLVAGCALYMVGVGFFLWESLPYHIAIWHGFVVAGAGAHYACIVGYVTSPTALRLTARPQVANSANR